jgi:hypothetical protein
MNYLLWNILENLSPKVENCRAILKNNVKYPVALYSASFLCGISLLQMKGQLSSCPVIEVDKVSRFMSTGHKK